MAEVPNKEGGVDGALERVRQRLYTAKETASVAPVEVPTEHQEPEHWTPEVPKRRLSATAWFFIVAFGFFLVAGITALLIIFLGGRSVGNERISIQFESPVSVSGGEEISFDLVIKNENPVETSDLVLSIDFPEEAFDPVTMEPLSYYTDSLSNIAPGASVRHSVPVTFFGAEDQKVSVSVRLEYRTPNSSAVFVKEEVRDLTIATAPLSIRVTAPEDISSGQTVTLKASVRSNADEPLSQVAVKAEFPFGFTLTGSDPQPVGSQVFVIGNLLPGEEEEVTITGILIGEDGDERVFRFSGGVLRGEGATALRAPAFTLATKSVGISRSFISTDLSLNQSREDLIVSPGETLSGLISWVNSLTSSITDAEIEIALSGDALEFGSTAVANGFYRSSDRTIIFDESTESGLRNLSPAETGAGAFTILVKDANDLSALRGASGTFTVSVSGRRAGDGGREERLTGTVVRTVKVMTDLSLTASAVRTVGPFENSGPFPPEAEKETTYTILWEVENTINTTANVVVSAVLPSYVRYTGFANPSGITYNDVSRTVTWTLGEVTAGTTREGAFQIALTPSSAQRGAAPVILTNIKLQGFDRFTQSSVGDDADALTTEIRNDPGFFSGDEDVQ